MCRRVMTRVVCGLACVLLAVATVFPGDEKPVDPIAPESFLKMVAALKQGGEPGLRTYVRENRPALSAEAILGFARKSLSKSEEPTSPEDRLRVACIALEELGDEQRLASALQLTGNYFEDLDDYARALQFYDRAFSLYEKLGDPTGQGKIWISRGAIAQFRGDNRLALEMFEKAGVLFEKAGDLVGQGDVCFCRSTILFRTGKPSEGLDLARKALAIYEKADHARGLGNVYHEIGAHHLSSGDPRQALEDFDRALVNYRRAGNPYGVAAVHEYRGNIFLRTGETEQARAEYEKSLELHENGGSTAGQGSLCCRLGNLFAQTGDLARARCMYEKALGFLERSGNQVELGSAYKALGNLAYRTGDNAGALEHYAKALVYYERTENAAGLGNVYKSQGDIFFRMGDGTQALALYDKAYPFYDKARSLIGMGSLHKSRGDVVRYTGDLARALAQYDLALQCFEKGGSALGQANVYRTRGDVFCSAGDGARALDMYDKALPLFEKAKSPGGQGYVYKNRGDVLLGGGDLTRALEMYDKALPLFEKTNSPWGQGSVYQQRGLAFFRRGDNARALEMFDRSLAFYEKANSPIGRGAVLLGRGEVYSSLGDDGRAMGMFEAARGEFDRAGYPDGRARALFGEAGLWARGKKPREALDRYERALALLEGLRRHSGLEELKSVLMRKELGNYDRAALFMLGNGFRENAFRTVERMRARLFLDRLAESQVDLSKGVPPELKAKRDEFESRLAILRDQRRVLLGENPEGEERDRQVAALSTDIASAEKSLADLEASIRLRNPLFASVEYPEIPTVEFVRNRVLRPGEVLLEYYLGGEEAWCFVLTRNAFHTVRLPSTREAIEREVKLLLGTLRPSRAGDRPSAGERLFGCLIRPLEKHLRGKKLIVAPDGVLARLPFEMLAKQSRGKRTFLVETHELRYVPSAAVLAFYRSRYEGGRTSGGFMGFGDPVYDFENYRMGKTEMEVRVSLAGLVTRGAGPESILLERIPASGVEVGTVGELFRELGREGIVRLREEARKERVRDPGMKDYAYLHFATHGLVREDFQALALSRLSGETDEGLLTMGEIMNLDWNARLVFLSGCETGLGAVEQGEGVTGLARAVMYAGTPAAVVSLWNVSDEGTRELVTRFYRILLTQGKTPASALREAKLQLLRGPAARSGHGQEANGPGRRNPKGATDRETPEALPDDLASPFYWAPFVVYGE